jgi:hypothetical protein
MRAGDGEPTGRGKTGLEASAVHHLVDGHAGGTCPDSKADGNEKMAVADAGRGDDDFAEIAARRRTRGVDR